MTKIQSEPSSPINQIAIISPILFLILVSWEVFLFLIPLIVQYRIPAVHDGMSYFSLQYYFLNNSVISGEIPQWIPFLTHGVVPPWGFALQCNLTQNILCILGRILQNLNFIPIFLIGIFIDNLILIVGCWLLGKKLFNHPITIFFVCITVLGSAIWPFQPWLNFHFYYAAPLIIYLGHEFLETGQWKYFVLGGNLLAIQACGQSAYFLPMTSLIIFIYFLFYFIFNFRAVSKLLINLNLKKGFFPALSLFILSLSLIYLVFTIGTKEIISYAPARLPGGEVDLKTFLSYGQPTSFLIKDAWKEILTGLAINLDYTLYIGILPLPLIVIGLFFNSNKKNLILVLTAAVVLLIASGTFVAKFFYHVWPMLKLYRHITCVSVFAKLFLCFIAGFGLDVLLSNRFSNKKIFAITIVLLGGSLLFLASNIFIESMDTPSLRTNVLSFSESFPILKLTKFDLSFVISKLLSSFSILFITGIFLLIFPFWHSSKIKNYLIIILLAFHMYHMWDYKWNELERQTYPADKNFRGLTRFQPPDFSIRRERRQEQNSREKIFYSKPVSGIYFYTNIFLFKDQIDHHLRVDYCLKPFNTLMKAYWGQSLKDPNILPLGVIPGQRLYFPFQHSAVKKIAGITEDKIQFFQNAYWVEGEQPLANIMTRKDYPGNLLFVSQRDSLTSLFSPVPWTSQRNIAANERIQLPYEIISFDSNNLTLKTFNPQTQAIWLFYSDVWHPSWESTVNGVRTPVYRANLAYKAVPLPPGENKIHFRFENKITTVLLKILGINSLFWIIFIFHRAFKIITNKAF